MSYNKTIRDHITPSRLSQSSGLINKSHITLLMYGKGDIRGGDLNGRPVSIHTTYSKNFSGRSASIINVASTNNAILYADKKTTNNDFSTYITDILMQNRTYRFK